jgi:hypothetical protein
VGQTQAGPVSASDAELEELAESLRLSAAERQDVAMGP